MSNKLKFILVLAAFCVVGAMDYTDEQVEQAYCQEMKSTGAWPKGYQCG